MRDKCRDKSPENLVSGYRRDMIRGCSSHISQCLVFLSETMTPPYFCKVNSRHPGYTWLPWSSVVVLLLLVLVTKCRERVQHCMTHTESDSPVLNLHPDCQ